MNTKEIKEQIIENFIYHFTSDEDERERMCHVAKQYVHEDHVDEIDQAKDDLGQADLSVQSACMKIDELTKRLARIENEARSNAYTASSKSKF
jgi:hypothetical protein